MPVAWRPDGQVVATILPGNGTVLGNPAITLSLYPSGAQHPSMTLSLPRDHQRQPERDAARVVAVGPAACRRRSAGEHGGHLRHGEAAAVSASG
ncbi:MAG: hypothetical protein ACRDHE_11240 [Ktedonobacterales bacterium]